MVAQNQMTAKAAAVAVAVRLRPRQIMGHSVPFVASWKQCPQLKASRSRLNWTGKKKKMAKVRKVLEEGK